MWKEKRYDSEDRVGVFELLTLSYYNINMKVVVGKFCAMEAVTR